MKYKKYLIILILMLSAPIYAEQEEIADAELLSSYQLGAGDTIRILVYHEPELSIDTKLTDAGSIIYPFLGEISVSGLTVGQLKEKITQGLDKRYLVDPKVSVSVLSYREFFVDGEVKRPGAYPYLPGLTAQKAISMAGGFSERASQSEVLIIRERDLNHKPIASDVGASVSPGDVIIVEESFF